MISRKNINIISPGKVLDKSINISSFDDTTVSPLELYGRYSRKLNELQRKKKSPGCFSFCKCKKGVGNADDEEIFSDDNEHGENVVIMDALREKCYDTTQQLSSEEIDVIMFLFSLETCPCKTDVYALWRKICSFERREKDKLKDNLEKLFNDLLKKYNVTEKIGMKYLNRSLTQIDKKFSKMENKFSSSLDDLYNQENVTHDTLKRFVDRCRDNFEDCRDDYWNSLPTVFETKVMSLRKS
ncbi:Phist protein (Pf-fam-b), unknown function [Plasmodium ovale wallikeri]|uniref:Plasmodium RESA N-terminal domain-containing protein n=1 Tax=Plasmodium ovale wallikeri TaxID=864142 RepID=A0A1A9AQ69_PLAOA|nr:Phist protein (Pf-fam-b), unknown function [Plasmodium ovale wallikeri]SBT58361.1 Phist protein (Pf-fam-b), unknown function [Plasmodium ovale wallikeri]